MLCSSLTAIALILVCLLYIGWLCFRYHLVGYLYLPWVYHNFFNWFSFLLVCFSDLSQLCVVYVTENGPIYALLTHVPHSHQKTART